MPEYTRKKASFRKILPPPKICTYGRGTEQPCGTPPGEYWINQNGAVGEGGVVGEGTGELGKVKKFLIYISFSF